MVHPMGELGLGLAALGRPAYINLGHGLDLEGSQSVKALEARSHALLDAAWSAGIRYLDCARSYGRAEAFLGGWLRSRAVEPGAALVASKWGYRYTANWEMKADVHEVKDHSLDNLRKQLPETGEHLWEYLDIYQIHSATLDTGVLEDVSVRRELARVRDERGLSIGLSVSGPAQGAVIDRAVEIEVGGSPLFTVVQATFNLLERSAQAALERASAAGRKIVIKEALANGRLTDRGVGVHRPGPFLAEALDEAATDLGAGRDTVALGALLHLPFVDVVLSGAATEAQLASNVAALKLPRERAAALWADTEAESADAYWTHRKTLDWT